MFTLFCLARTNWRTARVNRLGIGHSALHSLQGVTVGRKIYRAAPFLPYHLPPQIPYRYSPYRLHASPVSRGYRASNAKTTPSRPTRSDTINAQYVHLSAHTALHSRVAHGHGDIVITRSNGAALLIPKNVRIHRRIPPLELALGTRDESTKRPLADMTLTATAPEHRRLRSALGRAPEPTTQRRLDRAPQLPCESASKLPEHNLVEFAIHGRGIVRILIEVCPPRQTTVNGSTCIYPRLVAQPLREEYRLTGPLEPTNEWFAVAKTAGIKLCQATRQQHGCDFKSAMPTNLYGPGDNFHLHTSHVLPALIRKSHDAKLNASQSLEIWGTESPKRVGFGKTDDSGSLSLSRRTTRHKAYPVKAEPHPAGAEPSP